GENDCLLPYLTCTIDAAIGYTAKMALLGVRVGLKPFVADHVIGPLIFFLQPLVSPLRQVILDDVRLLLTPLTRHQVVALDHGQVILLLQVVGVRGQLKLAAGFVPGLNIPRLYGLLSVSDILTHSVDEAFNLRPVIVYLEFQFDGWLAVWGGPDHFVGNSSVVVDVSFYLLKSALESS